MPAVLLNQERQICPESGRKTWYISLFQVPKQKKPRNQHPADLSGFIKTAVDAP